MTNIKKNFTYDLPDDLYAQTNLGKKQVATLEYDGPETLYITVNTTTNKLVRGPSISAEAFATYNEDRTDQYAIAVDCNKDTLICALYDGIIDPDNIPNISEDIPGSDIPYVRDNPPMPDHTYEHSEIEYDRANGTFKKPLPWKKPFVTWQDKLDWRNTKLAAVDRTLSDDLPEALYAKVAEYKQYLRDFPAIFGAAFSVSIATAGSGYSVGDRMLISDPVYKNGQAISDILVTVTEVSATGEITAITKTTTNAYEYHPAAGTYNNVFFTTSSTGTGATFNMSKVKVVDPWKITPKEHPLGL